METMKERMKKIISSKYDDISESNTGDIAKLAEQGITLLTKIDSVNKKLKKKNVEEAKYLESALSELWDLYEQIGYNIDNGEYN